ncbi:MAG: cation diffusion facilitator family transporter [Petrimonas sp.]|jgi:cobalt-zinc-cadmium efflux system protein|nr:cation diffusion facilitator family transporter [Petrimonas sp.]
MSHSHSHTHSHGHTHTHAPGQANLNWTFALGIGINVAYAAVEAFFGFYADSLALLADAGHSSISVLVLLTAWAASVLAARKPTSRRTYGLRRSTILASLFNALILVAVLVVITVEAIHRFAEPLSVVGTTVIWVAGGGVLVNGITAFLFMAGSKKDLNIKSVFLYMAADVGVSLGMLLGGLAIYLTGMSWIDPAIALLIAAVIAFVTWGLLRDSMNLLLDAVPKEIDAREIKHYLSDLPGVTKVHDLHIWAISTTETALTAHLVIPEDVDPPDELLNHVNRELHAHHGIRPVTLQIERGESASPHNLMSWDNQA